MLNEDENWCWSWFVYGILFLFFFNGVGLVRSPVTATLPQISSRLFLVWGILWSFPEVKKTLNLFLFLLTPFICLFSIQSYYFIEELQPFLMPDSVPCACYLPTNQLVHHRGKSFMIALSCDIKIIYLAFCYSVWLCFYCQMLAISILC